LLGVWHVSCFLVGAEGDLMANRWNRAVASTLLGMVMMAGLAGCWRDRSCHRGEADALACHVERALDHVDASAAQRRTVEPLAREMAAEVLALRPGAERLRSLVMAEWNAATPDVDVLHQQVDAELDRVRATAHRVIDQAARIHGALTPEQREQVARAADWHRRWHR
jgi:hypothetical protein